MIKNTFCVAVTIFTLLSFTLPSCSRSGSEHDASGVFEATEILVSSELSGKILELDIEEGDSVEAGAVLGQIDTIQLFLKKRQLLATVRALEARRPQVRKQIAALEEQISVQKRERERFERLLKADAATQKQLDDITSSISVLEKQLEAQRSTLSNTSGGITEDAAALMVQVDQINDQLERSKIASPISGTILAKYAEAGEITMAGRALFKVAETKNMHLKAYITSDLLTRLKLNQTVKVFADFGEEGSREYSGEVIWISDKAEFTPKTIQTRSERDNLVYAIKIAIINDGFLKIGMYGGIDLGL
ncbi:HlyD family efflux transporter periplasmic adaptor subunit [Bacteroidales bacterium MB20-C3-3]|nr:HlyD family efflux transporter periplasmic adaptor subunit [Bacteroidales bacterium MB20-C3-3]